MEKQASSELDDVIAEQRETVRWSREVTERGHALALRQTGAMERIATALEKIAGTTEGRNS